MQGQVPPLCCASISPLAVHPASRCAMLRPFHPTTLDFSAGCSGFDFFLMDAWRGTCLGTDRTGQDRTRSCDLANVTVTCIGRSAEFLSSGQTHGHTVRVSDARSASLAPQHLPQVPALGPPVPPRPSCCCSCLEGPDGEELVRSEPVSSSRTGHTSWAVMAWAGSVPGCTGAGCSVVTGLSHP